MVALLLRVSGCIFSKAQDRKFFKGRNRQAYGVLPRQDVIGHIFHMERHGDGVWFFLDLFIDLRMASGETG